LKEVAPVSDDKVVSRSGYVLFHSGWPSNWHPSPFKIDGFVYGHGEQWMMAEKARAFKDAVRLDLILGVMSRDSAGIPTAVKTVTPRACKAYGRQVTPFDATHWAGLSRDRLYVGLLEKFRQNPDLGAKLLATGNDIIVEASPTDKIWGIGLAADHPDATDPAKWKGTNWLGEVLMRVRQTLKMDAARQAEPRWLTTEPSKPTPP
jgi:ribA/ribD-fused uncharacterized protein